MVVFCRWMDRCEVRSLIGSTWRLLVDRCFDNHLDENVCVNVNEAVYCSVEDEVARSSCWSLRDGVV